MVHSHAADSIGRIDFVKLGRIDRRCGSMTPDRNSSGQRARNAMNPNRKAWTLALVACLAANASPRLQAQSPAPVSANEPAIVIGADAPYPPGRGLWIGADFLLWAAKGDRLPPLLSASTAGTPRDQAGILGTPGTVVLFGDERVNDELRPGFRVRAGAWLDDCCTCGIEASLFYLDPAGDSLTAGGPGIVARPFINAATGLPDAQLVNFPGVLDGRASVSADSTVWGGDLSALHVITCDPCCRVALLAGYRFLGLSDTVTVSEDLVAAAQAGPVEPGTRFQVQDHFRTTNSFHGGVLGLRGEYERGRVMLRGTASVALGKVHQTIDIAGNTRITLPAQATTSLPGGILALQSNSGRFEHDDFAVLPAVGVSAGYRLSSRLQVFAGYDFLYLSRVTRPGDVIDVTVNTALIPPPTTGGPSRPAVQGGHSDYWLHGLSLGLEWRF
jgi:hypothetical protein